MSHFADMTWFALIISVALAVMSRRTTIDRVKYAFMSFFAFLLISIAIGWLMFPFSH
jgi:hypothetical protein